MPVIATVAAQSRQVSCDLPVAQPGLAPVPVECGAQILSAPISDVRGQPILQRLRAITVPGGVDSTIQWQMHDLNFVPVDLRSCLCLSSESSSASIASADSADSSGDCPYRIMFYIREYLSRNSTVGGSCDIEGYTDEANAANGLVFAKLPKSVISRPGIYFGEMAIVGTDSENKPFVLFSNVFYLYVSRGALSAKSWPPKGPPDIAEVRLFLRDSAPGENYLLDRLKFDPAEIAAAAAWCVEIWNETPPNIGYFTTTNFPFRRHWTEGIIGRLYQMAAESFRSNNLQYSAGGIQINDQDKEQPYEVMAEKHMQFYLQFVRRKKVELNLARAWGGSNSVYKRYFAISP